MNLKHRLTAVSVLAVVVLGFGVIAWEFADQASTESATLSANPALAQPETNGSHQDTSTTARFAPAGPQDKSPQPASIGQSKVAESEALADEQTLLRDFLVGEYGEEEADFRLMLTEKIHDWNEFKQAVELKEAETGQDYSKILLEVGIITGGLSEADLIAYLNRGAVSSVDVYQSLVYKGKVDLIAALATNGIIADLNSPHPATGVNAVSSYIRNIGYLPSERSVSEATADIEVLIELGVSPAGSLTEALSRVNPSNAEHKLAIAERLIELGVPIQPEHADLVANLRDRPYKQRFVALIGEPNSL